MAIEEQLPDQPKTLEGPTVANQKTIATIFTVEQLERTAFLPSLVQVINTSFFQAHSARPELRMHTTDRLGSIDDFYTTVKQDPASFIVIVSHPGSSSIIATASVRRYHGPPSNSDSPWARRIPVEAHAEEWELKLMATDPGAQRCGLATFMLALVEKEVVARALQTRPPKSTTRKIKMVLTTPRELLGEYYARRGYRKDYETFRGEGFNFHIAHMSKVLCAAPAEPGVASGS